jgi:CRISPR system Cascade subunit CasC
MKLIELHILQSFPVSCLNRDDVGSPKTAVFGGVNRARISSQCLKRAIREQAHNLQPTLCVSYRSRLFIDKITDQLLATGEDKAVAPSLAKTMGHYLGKLDPKDLSQVKTLMFLSPLEFKRLAGVLHGLDQADKDKLCDAIVRINPDELAKVEEVEEEETEENDETKPEAKPKKEKGQPKALTAKQFTKLVAGVLKGPVRKEWKKTGGLVKDAADIGIFGRMVASDHSLTLEGAGLFSHALSTHRADNELDFFAAVDDLQKAEQSGAGYTDTLQFTSACYYRYAALNLDLLFYQKDDKGNPSGHLACFLGDEHAETRRKIVDAFLRAALLAVPNARKNSMNANTVPAYVLGTLKDNGHPIQLVNAFESPVRAKGDGLVKDSIAALEAELKRLKETWGVAFAAECRIPEKSLETFCAELLAGL